MVWNVCGNLACSLRGIMTVIWLCRQVALTTSFGTVVCTLKLGVWGGGHVHVWVCMCGCGYVLR